MVGQPACTPPPPGWGLGGRLCVGSLLCCAVQKGVECAWHLSGTAGHWLRHNQWTSLRLKSPESSGHRLEKTRNKAGLEQAQQFLLTNLDAKKGTRQAISTELKLFLSQYQLKPFRVRSSTFTEGDSICNLY